MRVEKKKIAQAPGYYQEGKHKKWSEKLQSAILHGHVHKGKFNRQDRVLVFAELMEKTRKDNMPAPGAYKVPKAPEPPLSKFTKSQKSSAFIDAAIYQSDQTPSLCYKEVESLTKLVKPKALSFKIHNETEIQAEQAKRIGKKSNLPDVGTYEHVKSFNSTQVTPGYSQKILKAPKTMFYENSIKRTKFVPPPNHYKIADIEKGFKALSKSPPQIRMKRH